VDQVAIANNAMTPSAIAGPRSERFGTVGGAGAATSRGTNIASAISGGGSGRVMGGAGGGNGIDAMRDVGIIDGSDVTAELWIDAPQRRHAVHDAGIKYPQPGQCCITR
jgi:hypothetical protein